MVNSRDCEPPHLRLISAATFVITLCIRPPLAADCTCTGLDVPGESKLGDTVTFTGTYSADCVPPVSFLVDDSDFDCPYTL